MGEDFTRVKSTAQPIEPRDLRLRSGEQCAAGAIVILVTLLFHVDESIETDLWHVHLGVLADGDQVAKFTKRSDDLQWEAIDAGARGGLNIEFHGYDMAQQQGAWRRVHLDESVALMVAILEQLSELGIEVLIRAADLKSVRHRRGADCDVYPWMYSNLLERLNERLRDRDEHGLVVADEQHQHAARLQVSVNHWQRYETGGYRGQRLTRVLDAAHFVDSTLSRMVQLADVAAYVVRRRLHKPTETDTRAEAAMSKLYNLVVAAVPPPDGQYFTIWRG